MMVARKGSALTLTSAVLLTSALLLSACEENDLVEPAAEGVQPASANAAPEASLAKGNARSAAADNLYSDRLTDARIELPGDNVVEVLDIDLPAGQYVITGHVTLTNADRDVWTYVTCRLQSSNDARILGNTVTYLQENRGGGVAPTQATPVAGYVAVPSGSTKVWVECQRQGQVGSPEIIGGGGGLTHIIAARVG